MRRALSLSLLLAAALSLTGCGQTSSTEVGVRTNLFGIFEKRGEQQLSLIHI